MGLEDVKRGMGTAVVCTLFASENSARSPPEVKRHGTKDPCYNVSTQDNRVYSKSYCKASGKLQVRIVDASFGAQKKFHSSMGYVQVYITAREVAGRDIPEDLRAQLWRQVNNEQALVIIARMLADLDEQSTRLHPEGDVDLIWAAAIENNEMRNRLMLFRKKYGRKILAPQIMLLAISEVLEYCPRGPSLGTDEGLDVIIACMLGIGDEAAARTDNVPWGVLDAGLAADLIANQHFHQSLSVAEQMSWVLQSWLQEWPDNVPEYHRKNVGGSPRELFRESTGVNIEEFAAIAAQIYAQFRLRGKVTFEKEFFEWARIHPETTSYFLGATCASMDQLRGLMHKERVAAGHSAWAFNTLRQYPLVRLSSGEVLVLRLGFMVERAMSETTYFDVKEHLRKYDAEHGTKRRDAFRECINGVLEHEVGVTLRRIFKGRGRVIDERQMQIAYSTKNTTPKICDYAVRTKAGWLLFEVTNRSMTGNVIAAQGGADELDAELRAVLIGRKINQLTSTIDLLRTDSKKIDKRKSRPGDVYLPFVLTPPAGLPWNAAVHARAHEKISQLGDGAYGDFAAFALLHLRDLRILESAAEQGEDIVRLLKSWRLDEPATPFSVFLNERGVSLGHPKWVRDSSWIMTNRIISKMRSARLDTKAK